MKGQLGTSPAIALVLVLMVGAGWSIANAIDPRLDAADIAGLREDTARITPASSSWMSTSNPTGVSLRRDKAQRRKRGTGLRDAHRGGGR